MAFNEDSKLIRTLSLEEGEVRASGLAVFKKIDGEVHFLLIQKSPAQHWAPPKDMVPEFGDEWTTALKATMDQTGLPESALKIYKDIRNILTYTYRGKTKIVTYWLAELLFEDPPIDTSTLTHPVLQWYSLAEACDNVHFPDMIDTLNMFHDNISRFHVPE